MGDWAAVALGPRSRFRFPIRIPLFRAFSLSPLSAVLVVSYFTPNLFGEVCGAQWGEPDKWEQQGELGRSGRRLGRVSFRAPLAFPLFPNLFLLFPFLAVSAVSYSTPNPVGEGALGAAGGTG